MKEAEIIKKIAGLASQAMDFLYAKHLAEREGCLAFGKLIKAAKIGTENLTPIDKKHLDSCIACRRKFDQLRWQVVASIPRHSLLAAAGASDTLSTIPSHALKECGVPDNTAIICEKRARGYAVRVEGSIPLCLTMVFMKDDVELFRSQIDEEIPEDDQLIAPEWIAGWTDIKFLRKQ